MIFPSITNMFAAGAGKCCPDGLSCVPSSLDNVFNLTCQWTGQPIIPPPGYRVNPRQLAGTEDTTSTREMPPMDPIPVWIANNGSEMRAGNATMQEQFELRQTCSTGYLCPATTLPTGCSRTGARWRAPSCKCYDQPLPAMFAGTPPALDLDASGRWVRRGTSTRASIQVRCRHDRVMLGEPEHRC
jgi:hypothetical protein